jgi:serine protease AprX
MNRFREILSGELNMPTTLKKNMRQVKFVWQAVVLIIALLPVLVAFGPANPASQGISRAQPQLLQLAAADPEQMVSVIVQRAGRNTGLETLVAESGGRVTADLSIINAFAANMTAGAAAKLAALSSVRWVSLDAKMVSSTCSKCVNTTNLANTYIDDIQAIKVWNKSPYRQGNGIGVAVVDSGVNPNGDLYTQSGVDRQVADVHFNSDYNQTTFDGYGHGTVVSTIVAGDGSDSNGKYIGVAPMANIINVKVSNDDGSAMMKDVVSGLQWVLNNKQKYNIRVVNLSLNSSLAESYNTSPLDAAVEILWFNNIVVVASAGNSGGGNLYAPANDPFVITVGATNDNGSSNLNDDVVASFSAYGTTDDGFAKPDIVAPGTNIVGRMVNQNMGMGSSHPANKVGNQYFRISGTSVAAPIVSGVVALLLQDEPSLNPDQVKYRLMSTANQNWGGYDAAKSGAGYVDANAAVTGTSTQSANTNILPSQLLSTGSAPISWGSVGWNSVGWNSVGWNSVGWNSVGWNSVGWNSDYWGN